MKKFSIGCGGIIAILIIIGMFGALLEDKETASEPVTMQSASDVTPAPAAKVGEITKELNPVSNWNYSTSTDEMSGDKRNFAGTTSYNSVEFEFPYHGGSKGNIFVRNVGQGDEVVFEVTKGQLLSGTYGGHKLRVKFDDAAPLNYSYNDAADGSSTAAFINSSKGFISKLKKSKKVLIEASFFDAGTKIFRFNTEGLEW